MFFFCFCFFFYNRICFFVPFSFWFFFKIFIEHRSCVIEKYIIFILSRFYEWSIYFQINSQACWFVSFIKKINKKKPSKLGQPSSKKTRRQIQTCYWSIEPSRQHLYPFNWLLFIDHFGLETLKGRRKIGWIHRLE